MFTSFFRISALVALVPMPEPLIWLRSSSSSISWPAFSMARIIEPEVYRFGGEVSPSFTENPSACTVLPFRSPAASAISEASSVLFGSSPIPLSAPPSASCLRPEVSPAPPAAPFFPPGLIPAAFIQPSSTQKRKFAKKCSFPSCSSTARFSNTAGG